MVDVLPPDLKGNSDNDNNMVFKFYNLADDKVLNVATSERVDIFGGNADDIEFLSSSHGWLTLFNHRNYDLFLFNPLSSRHIKLPPIHTLKDFPQHNLKDGFGCVTKVITSCSPEEQDCRVMMSFGPHRRLFFCSPTSSNAEWIRIGHLDFVDEDDHVFPRGYQDFVYSTRKNRLYCMDTVLSFEYWILQDTGTPMFCECNPSVDVCNFPFPIQSEEELELKVCSYNPFTFLVVEEESGDIFWVRRHVMPHMSRKGYYVDYKLNRLAAEKLPHKAMGFDVHKYDPVKGALVYMDGSLDGLALFIGNNHSFAVSASEYSELEPDSIYYTDANQLISPISKSKIFVGHDLGIFNYKEKTFSPCYYPCDKEKIASIIPAPMWFTPTN